MSTFDIDSFARASGGWFEAGWETLIHAYRLYQCAVVDISAISLIDQRRSFYATKIVVTRQIVRVAGISDDEANAAVEGRLVELCGDADNPKNLDQWRRQQ